MATITEDYVSFEIAKLLKEKGFNSDTTSCYILEDGTHHIMSDKVVQGEYYESQDSNEHGHLIQAPTLQMAMKWLREVYNIIVEPNSVWSGKKWEYQFFIVTPQNADSPYYEYNLYKSYEECVEAAIKYCLENLI